MQLVSRWTTYYVVNDGNGFGANISIPGRDIDGYNLAPGEWFSFWGSIGPVTVERGYHYGGAIINGRSVAGGALGEASARPRPRSSMPPCGSGSRSATGPQHYYYIDRYPTVSMRRFTS
jgi:hypothetical protein